MAAGKHRENHDVERTKKMISLIMCEISLSQIVCELVFGVNIFDLDFGVQVSPINQPIKSNSVGSGHGSHRRTSALYDHFDHSIVVFRKV